MSTPSKRVHVVINPASGNNESILNTLNDVFRQCNVAWDVSITHKYGDATRLAREAAASGVDLVMGYGGDGTQMEVANGLMGSGIPQGILPGGTGNAMAFELEIPRNLAKAAELLCKSKKRRHIDVGQIGDQYFMLRTYTGIQAEQRVSREMKDRFGSLAYSADVVHTLMPEKRPKYQLTIDGDELEDEGFICLIINAGSLSTVSVPTTAKIDVSDGLLDVFIVNNNLSSLRALASFYVGTGRAKKRVHHWQGREISVQTDPSQEIWIDGESYGPTPFTATVVPQALEVVVP